MEEEVKAMIGREFVPRAENPLISSRLSCLKRSGDGILIEGKGYEGWEYGLITCQGRWVLTLERVIGPDGEYTRRKVVDAVLLPAVEAAFDPDPHVLQIMDFNSCSVFGEAPRSLVVVARFGDHEHITWRNGIQHAWTFDVKRQRIVPVPRKRIICQKWER